MAYYFDTVLLTSIVFLLQDFKHINIVSYRESISEGKELNIIMEFCEGGDLGQLIT